jgi:hypothetical protein
MITGPCRASASLPRATGLAQPQHQRRRAPVAALRAFQGDQSKFDHGKVAKLPDELIDWQKPLVAASVAGRDPDPAGRRIPEASEPRLSIGILCAHAENVARTQRPVESSHTT